MLSSTSETLSTPLEVSQSEPEVKLPGSRQPEYQEEIKSTQPVSLPPSEPSRCPVTKVSMLYGAHKFSQLENALEGHRRHSERWGAKFTSLERDLTTRKLSHDAHLYINIRNKTEFMVHKASSWLRRNVKCHWTPRVRSCRLLLRCVATLALCRYTNHESESTGSRLILYGGSPCTHSVRAESLQSPYILPFALKSSNREH